MPKSREKDESHKSNGKETDDEHVSESDGDEAFQEDILHEVKKLGRNLRKSQKKSIKEVGDALRDDVHRDVERILEAIQTLPRGAVDTSGLRTAGLANVAPPWQISGPSYGNGNGSSTTASPRSAYMSSTRDHMYSKVQDSMKKEVQIVEEPDSDRASNIAESYSSLQGSTIGKQFPTGSPSTTRQPEDEDGLDDTAISKSALPCTLEEPNDNIETSVSVGGRGRSRTNIALDPNFDPNVDIGKLRTTFKDNQGARKNYGMGGIPSIYDEKIEKPRQKGSIISSASPPDDGGGGGGVSRSSRKSTSYDQFESVAIKKAQEEGVQMKGTRVRISMSRERARADLANKSKKPWSAMTLGEFIQTPMFDNLVGGVILMNAAVIGAQTDYNAKNLTTEVPLAFFMFEQFFATWFTLELVLRIYVFKCAFFKMFTDGWVWNYFDTMVVSAQLLEVFFDLILRSVANLDASGFRVLRVLRILRLVRILRVVRVLHLISELRAIVSSIVGSFKSLVWVVVLLLLMMYIVAVFFTQSLTDHIMDLKDVDPLFRFNNLSDEESSLYYYFGSLPRAILSLWQSMSGGLDWDSLAGPFFTKISFSTGFAFASFIAFALLALMNVVTGVFVQTALLSARDEEDKFMTGQIISLFKVADKEAGQKITWDEVVTSLEEPAMEKEWKSIGVTAEDARYLFKLLDVEDTGQVPFEEFMGGCLRLSGQAKALDLLTVMQEARKNDEVLHKKLDTIAEALIDAHESVHHVQEDLPGMLDGLREIMDKLETLIPPGTKDSPSMPQQFGALSRVMQEEFGSMRIFMTASLPRPPPAPILPKLPGPSRPAILTGFPAPPTLAAEATETYAAAPQKLLDPGYSGASASLPSAPPSDRSSAPSSNPPVMMRGNQQLQAPQRELSQPQREAQSIPRPPFSIAIPRMPSGANERQPYANEQER